MRTPAFWRCENFNLKAFALLPFSWGVSLMGSIRQSLIKPWDSGEWVCCVGNVVVGGAGKTPVAIDLGRRLVNRKKNFCYLSRGYGGFERGPHLVNSLTDHVKRVGDEPLLLSKIAPSWISRNRRLGVQLAIKNGAKNIIMDDGLQNPHIKKSFSFLVVDGSYGVGNGKIFPAGPLREPLDRALKRTDAVIIVGRDKVKIKPIVSRFAPTLPILNVLVRPGPELAELISKPLFAFAGIAHPDKFFSLLEDSGCNVKATKKFSDHHIFSSKELSFLRREAKKTKSYLVTTEKDWIRLPKEEKEDIKFLTIVLQWQDEHTLNSILDLFK